jgi:protein O-GlcNAc transferase
MVRRMTDKTLAEAAAALEAGDNDLAFQLAKAVLRVAPATGAALRLAGLAAMRKGVWPVALRYFDLALAAAPEDAEIARLRDACREKAGDLAAPTVKPEAAPPPIRLVNLLLAQEKLPQAEKLLRQMLVLQPEDSSAHSSLLFCTNYRMDLGPEQIHAEYRRWDEMHGRPRLPQPLVHDNKPEPGRRLKLGYVSPDFRRHAVALFFEPLLATHDRTAFEIYLYSEVQKPDHITERLKGQADHWRSTVGLNDAAVAAMIRADGIDVLVDLAGHTGGNRLLAFARKPAPVQFSYLIGAGCTTGLSAIDGFFADDAMAPPGSEHLFSERVIRLGRVPLAYRPPEGMAEIGTLPALRNGHVTFGHFGRTVRLNESVVATWAALLQAVPKARLMLNAKTFLDDGIRQDFSQRFAAHGIAPERLSLVYTHPQTATWAAYNEIDIALDPFPHNAGTTTIEALWMGAPVVSMAARPPLGRFGASILGALGMGDWVAEDATGYLAIASRWANDLEALAAIRAGLRPRFAASPLRDATGLVRAMEAGYRQLWREWCASAGA